MIMPCEECLVYAICKYRKIIVCERLYKWLNEGNRQDIIMDYFPNWIHVSYKPDEAAPRCYAFRVSADGDYQVTGLVDGEMILSEVFSSDEWSKIQD